MSKLLTTHDVAALLGLSSQTLDLWRMKGRGPQWVTLGTRNIRYRQADVDAYIQSLTQAPKPLPEPPTQPAPTHSLDQLPPRARNVLERERLTLQQALSLTDTQWRALGGIGTTTLDLIRAVWPSPLAYNPPPTNSPQPPSRVPELEAEISSLHQEIALLNQKLARIEEDKRRQKLLLDRLKHKQSTGKIELYGSFEDEDGDHATLTFEPLDLVMDDDGECGVYDADGDWFELKTLDSIRFPDFKWRL